MIIYIDISSKKTDFTTSKVEFLRGVRMISPPKIQHWHGHNLQYKIFATKPK